MLSGWPSNGEPLARLHACGQAHHALPVIDALSIQQVKNLKAKRGGANGTTGCYQNKKASCPCNIFSCCKPAPETSFPQ